MLFKGSALVIFIFVGFCLAADEFPSKFTLNTGFDIPAIGCKLNGWGKK
jgi:hypothetical protein